MVMFVRATHIAAVLAVVFALGMTPGRGRCCPPRVGADSVGAAGCCDSGRDGPAGACSATECGTEQGCCLPGACCNLTDPGEPFRKPLAPTAPQVVQSDLFAAPAWAVPSAPPAVNIGFAPASASPPAAQRTALDLSDRLTL